MVLSLLSMILGNLIAIAQTNIKRMLAYSTIANMGFMLMGFLTANLDGFSAAMFYVVVYVLTTLASFGMVMLLSRAGFEADQLDDFKGLNQRSPWWAFMMLIVMFSLAGIPPTVGFYAKFSVIEAAVNAGFVWLAVIARARLARRRVLLPAHREAHVLRRRRPTARRSSPAPTRGRCSRPTASRCSSSASSRSTSWAGAWSRWSSRDSSERAPLLRDRGAPAWCVLRFDGPVRPTLHPVVESCASASSSPASST